MARIKGNGNFADRTTEDEPLIPLAGSHQFYRELSVRCRSEACEGGWRTFTLTGRRAVRMSRETRPQRGWGTLVDEDGQRYRIAGEGVCQRCGAVRWVWVPNTRDFFQAFGPVIPANPLLARLIQRAIEQEAKRLVEEAERARLRNYEPPEMLEWDELEVAL